MLHFLELHEAHLDLAAPERLHAAEFLVGGRDAEIGALHELHVLQDAYEGRSLGVVSMPAS